MKLKLFLGSQSKRFLAQPVNDPSSLKDQSVAEEVGDGFRTGKELAPKDSSCSVGLPGDCSNIQAGSTEEIFFDARACLESDCEDEFRSVNGEFTPSVHGTPDYQRTSFSLNPKEAVGANKVSNLPLHITLTGRRKKLADFFKETMQDEAWEDQNSFIIKLETLSTPAKSEGTPNISRPLSIRSSEVSLKKLLKIEKDKKLRASQCCLPNLMTSLSFRERKKHVTPCKDAGCD